MDTIRRDDRNTPDIEIINNSDTASIVSFVFSIAGTGAVFDGVVGGGFAPIIDPVGTPFAFGDVQDFMDNTDDPADTDFADATFSAGLPPGGSFRFIIDIDPVDAGASGQFQSLFFNNGDDPNAVETVVFDNGVTLMDELLDDEIVVTSDAGEPLAIQFSNAIATPVPLGASSLLLAGGLCLAAALRRIRG